MLPSQLTARSFDSYPPKARALAVANLALIQQLPIAFAGLLLREMHSYDWRFPAEQRTVENQFAFLASETPQQRETLLRGFASLSLPANLIAMDWVATPQPFLDGLTTHLWASHQHDGFRDAAAAYAEAWTTARPDPMPAIPRLAIVVLNPDLRADNTQLFRKLRPHGVYFSNVDGTNGWPSVISLVNERAQKSPEPWQHWYIEGGAFDPALSPHLAAIGYDDAASTRAAILHRMQEIIGSGHGGPEELRTRMAETTPADLGLPSGDQETLSRFKVSVLGEGSGTQIFSTTFVQWSAREALRRAQPATLLLRYTPRQRQLPMNEMLSGASSHPEPDPAGSVVDADMGAFYTWINQQRLTGASQSSFLAWSQVHNAAVAISPTLPRATESAGSITVDKLLQQLG
ncbi:hypothetical protein [Silvibacterium dinghuense]|uniref:Uncharacterized protein n=1 Tax=Silvibacterium dinghuense TaxID=1560006 RepID=A0A4Q1SH01_9BACT|nr:hypothetical protein [Silvibacterium dinghuense]RXS96804.1 hypothetical protein ESZ00_02315 [Silvibacterium dinghuense]GGG93778.1 hypothetical protein GCM10011586_05700 [Silvibacterium dinghuense]